MNAVQSYYAKLESALGQTEWLVDAVLIGIAAVCIMLVMFSKSRSLKLLFAAYLLNP